MNVVCKQWTENLEANGYHIDDILSLIKEAYRVRLKEGISFATLNYTIDDFLAERTDNDYWFLAFDEKDLLLGTARLTIKGNYGEICNFAVLPNCQGKHIGSLLLQASNRFAQNRNMDYLVSYTAVNASSSVSCHLNNGFCIAGIGKDKNRCYTSYYFRNQISNSLFWKCCLFVKIRYYLSYIKLLIME